MAVATEKHKVYMREYSRKNRGKINERKRRHYQEHIEDRMAKHLYYEKNKEKIRQYQTANAEEIKQYQLAHREEGMRRARTRNQQIKLEVIFHYSDGTMQCVRCGFGDIRALTIDHIAGGGHKHRKEIKSIYPWLRRNGYPGGYQTLCMNCQFIKKIEEGENRWRR